MNNIIYQLLLFIKQLSLGVVGILFLLFLTGAIMNICSNLEGTNKTFKKVIRCIYIIIYIICIFAIIQIVISGNIGPVYVLSLLMHSIYRINRIDKLVKGDYEYSPMEVIINFVCFPSTIITHIITITIRKELKNNK